MTTTRKPREDGYYLVTGPDASATRLVKAASARSAVAHVAASSIKARRETPADLLDCGRANITAEKAGEEQAALPLAASDG